jgi:ABC-type cobalamin/Fe3+-siderophores transport system ATPase subunit
MIEIKDLSLKRGHSEIIKNFSCTIAKGAVTAIIGSNGAGKSTLLSAIAGERYSTSGEILINGLSAASLSVEEFSKIRSVAQQSHSYWMAYSAREIIALGNDETPVEKVSEILRALDLDSFLDQKVTALSGGQLQRIEIARAFMRDTPLVLLDEPFASQDVASIERLKKFLVAEKGAGKTIVIVAHARSEELSWCDKVIELEAR